MGEAFIAIRQLSVDCGRLPHGTPEEATSRDDFIVPEGRDVMANHGVDCEIRKVAFDSPKFLILNHTLEHFAEDQVSPGGMIAAASEFIQIAMPTNLSPQRQNLFLFLQADQRSQGFVDDRLLCRQGSQFPRLLN